MKDDGEIIMDKFMFEDKESMALKNVYDKLQDDESRKIYLARSLYSLTDNKDYMKEIIHDMAPARYLLSELSRHKDKKKVLFGAGTWGNAILEHFPELHWDAIADNKKAGTKINGIKIISFEQLKNEYFDACVVISVLFQCDEVYEQLITNGFNENNIIRLGTVMEKMQYFDLPELKPVEDEVFLDVGGYDGATTERFIEWNNRNFRKVYFFEPNENYMNISKEKFHDEVRIMYMPYITWNKETKLGFISAGVNSCIVEDNSNNGIKTIRIDKCLTGGIFLH